nr:immunoglobulin light chain junction region [Mus musculus]
CHQWNIYPYTF